jgi:hypothetical protein
MERLFFVLGGADHDVALTGRATTVSRGISRWQAAAPPFRGCWNGRVGIKGKAGAIGVLRPCTYAPFGFPHQFRECGLFLGEILRVSHTGDGLREATDPLMTYFDEGTVAISAAVLG